MREPQEPRPPTLLELVISLLVIGRRKDPFRERSKKDWMRIDYMAFYCNCETGNANTLTGQDP